MQAVLEAAPDLRFGAIDDVGDERDQHLTLDISTDQFSSGDDVVAVVRSQFHPNGSRALGKDGCPALVDSQCRLESAHNLVGL